MAAAAVVFTAPAQAAFVVTMTETPTGVGFVGSGTLNISSLTFGDDFASFPGGTSQGGILFTGGIPLTSVPYDGYLGLMGPTNYGTGGNFFASEATGSLVGVSAISSSIIILGVPDGYQSGAALTSTAFAVGQTFDSLGVTPGSFEWTWGSGATADSYSLNIVPEPTSAAAILGLGGLALLRRRRASI